MKRKMWAAALAASMVMNSILWNDCISSGS